MIIRSCLLGFALALVTLTKIASADITFFDGTFNNSDWTAAKIFDSSPGQGATFTVGQTLSGGDPDAFRETVHSWPGPGDLLVGDLRVVSIYNPSPQGSIASIDYSYDAKAISALDVGAVAYTPLLYQAGVYYEGSYGLALAGQGWTHLSFSQIATDFGRVDGLPGTPDFASTGAPIEFGYATGNGSCCSNSVPWTTDSGIDNWSVTIHQSAVPADSHEMPAKILVKTKPPRTSLHRPTRPLEERGDLFGNMANHTPSGILG
jgi:hypothetical protein